MTTAERVRRRWAGPLRVVNRRFWAETGCRIGDGGQVLLSSRGRDSASLPREAGASEVVAVCGAFFRMQESGK